MKVYEIYFSPTGGTKKVIDTISSIWDGEKSQIDLSKKVGRYEFHEDDICIFAVPSFSGRVPAFVIDQMQNLKGNKAKAILIVAYGNRHIDDTLLELQDAVHDLGFKSVAGVSAVTEHSIFRQFASNRPDEKDKEELLNFAKRIKDSLNTYDIGQDLQVPGNFPYKETKGSNFKPIGGERCERCGTCAKECPVEAIPFESPNLVDAKVCISCMRCISVCPINARENKKELLEKGAEMLSKVCTERRENELFLV